MGNVLIEAFSMGIAAEGRDINPLAIRGARVNLRHYGYDDNKVAIQDMNTLQGHYDAAILDLPYNLCSVFPEGEVADAAKLTSVVRSSCHRQHRAITRVADEHGLEGPASLHDPQGEFCEDIWLCE